MKEKPDLVIVEWGDAWSSAGWADGPSEHKAVTVFTVGFLEKNDKVGVTVVGRIADYNNEWGAGLRSFIPAGMIKKIKKIKV